MGPDLIQQGYGAGWVIDWWLSGVILYETLTQAMVCFTI